MHWIKAFHIIFMVTWFVGLFYLPRLFVYHAQTEDVLSHDRFVVMERKLFIIMTIGAGLTLLFGFWLLFQLPKIPAWLTAKLIVVAILVAYHIYCYRILVHFVRQQNSRSHIFYRWFNEAPALLLIVIVLLAVGKQQLI